MSTPTVWSNVAVAIQTALGSPIVLTAITKANPAVVTSVGHGRADGDIVLLKLSGMKEINHMLARVANKTTDTFELEGVDSTLFSTFTSGTAEVPTFGAAADTIQDVSSSGGDVKPIDTTTIHQDQDTEIPGNKSAKSYTFGNIWDPSDPALIEMRKADRVKGERCVQFTFANGKKAYFNGYAICDLSPGGSKGEVVTTQTGFKLRGPVNTYAS
jgi:hypothetical protein